MRRSFGAALVALLVISLSPAASARSIQPRLDAGQRGRPEVMVTNDDALSRSLRSGKLSPARYALERARSLFDLASVRDSYGDVKRVKPRDATLSGKCLSKTIGKLHGAVPSLDRGLHGLLFAEGF